jgi:hypothetical protein
LEDAPSYIPFSWTAETSLAAELSRPIESVSIEAGFGSLGRPESITLWRSDGTGLEIRSEMHDVADRTEVGVLSFNLAPVSSKVENLTQLPASFSSTLRPFKMVIEESGKRAESGLVLQDTADRELLIVASGAPCYLYIRGVLPMRPAPDSHQPEYPISEYKIVALK